MIGTIVLYIIVFGICECIFYYNKNGGNKSFGKVCFLPIVLLSLLAGLRSPEVGNDTLGYYRIFIGTDTYSMEPGLPFFIKLVKLFSKDATVFFVLLSFLIVFLFIRSLWEYREICQIHYSFFLFYFFIYFMTFSGIRQWVAVAIVFYVSHFLLIKNKIIPFAIGLAVASLFHLSAISAVLILLFWIVFQVKSLSKKALFIVFITTVVFINYSVISNMLYVRYSHFLSNGSEMTFGLYFYYRILLLLACYYIYKKDDEKEYGEIVIQKMNVVDIVTYSLGFFESSIGRLSWYFLPLSLIYYGYILKKKDKTLLGHITNIMIVVLTIYSFYSWMDPQNKLSTYSFFWNYM